MNKIDRILPASVLDAINTAMDAQGTLYLQSNIVGSKDVAIKREFLQFIDWNTVFSMSNRYTKEIRLEDIKDLMREEPQGEIIPIQCRRDNGHSCTIPAWMASDLPQHEYSFFIEENNVIWISDL